MTMSAGAKFRQVLAKKGLVETMAAHSPLSAMLAAEAGFDATQVLTRKLVAISRAVFVD